MRFEKVWGQKARPLLIARPGGVAVRTQQGNATASHVDHTLATLAEVGTPLDFPLRTPQGAVPMERLLQRARERFDINQVEYEWSALAIALYVVDGRPWYTDEGERIDFDRLADRLMRQQYVQGVCYGNHRLFTLAMLLRIDDQKELLTTAARRDVLAHLSEATQRLVSSQAPEGYWDRNWPNAKADAKEDPLDELSRKLLATDMRWSGGRWRPRNCTRRGKR